jgi:hypothetical protein
MTTRAVAVSTASMAIAVAFSCTPAVEARDAAPPKRIGPVVTIASGSGWKLTGWRSSAGIALAYRAPKDSGTMYRIAPRYGTSLSTWLSPTGSLGKWTRVIGVVTPNAARVEVTSSNGRGFTTHLYRAPPSLKTSLRFFRVLVKSGSPPRWKVQAFDRHGKQIGMVGQGRL